jgi:hypothetical protein
MEYGGGSAHVPPALVREFRFVRVPGEVLEIVRSLLAEC